MYFIRPGLNCGYSRHHFLLLEHVNCELQIAALDQCFAPAAGQCHLLFKCQVGGLQFIGNGFTYEPACIQLRFEGTNPEVADR